MILGYRAGSGFLYRAHPLTLVALVGATLVLVFALPAPTGASAVLAGLLSIALAGGAARIVPTAAAIAAPFWLFLALIHVVLGDSPARALMVGTQVSAMVVSFLILLSATHPGRLMDALLERGWPSSVAYLATSALQTVPRLQARAGAIHEAQRARGLRVRGIVGRIRTLGPLALPLVLSALHEADERALALTSRGVGRGIRPTPIAPAPDSRIDRLLRAVLAIVTVLAVAWRVGTWL